MDYNKGKPVTTSVPSIAIRFHANAEELEELYISDDEITAHLKDDSALANSSGSGEAENSPIKVYLPKLIKRSASIDTSPSAPQDSSPPADPWRFFTDIKGKITKSVEEKLTEIKSRNQEDGSPYKNQVIKDKDSSSVSDSEDLSESSISKTCGIVSTTEGVEMSSEDDSPSLEKEADKEPEEEEEKKERKKRIRFGSTVGLRQRFRMMRQNKAKEGTVAAVDLEELYNINTGLQSSSVSQVDEVESGVDALEEDFHEDKPGCSKTASHYSMKDKGTKTVRSISAHWLRGIARTIDNVDVDEESVLTIREVDGNDIRSMVSKGSECKTVFAPRGFVDMRRSEIARSLKYMYLMAMIIFFIMYYYLQLYSVFLAGVTIGVVVTVAIYTIYARMFPITSDSVSCNSSLSFQPSVDFVPISPIKEHQPITKYEGWMNEYPDVYDPYTYHISQTQSVFLRLQGSLLRVSHCKSKIPKRALWNEPKIKPHFTFHRIYNLLGARILLLPEGLTKKRHWSKKYPICIELSGDQMNFDYYREDDLLSQKSNKSIISIKGCEKKSPTIFKKKPNVTVQPQQFSKLTEENEEIEIESELSRPSSPSPISPDASFRNYKSRENLSVLISPHNRSITKDEQLLADVSNTVEELLDIVSEKEEHGMDDDQCSLPDEEWCMDHVEDNPEKTTRLYLFGRTDREKEDWFRKLMKATHKGIDSLENKNNNVDNDVQSEETISSTLLHGASLEEEYNKFMMVYTKPYMFKFKHDKSIKESKSNIKFDQMSASIFNIERQVGSDTLWLNALIARVFFDCVRDVSITMRIKERIQRKLSAIKLPYFIEEFIITEFSLGETSPLIHEASLPVLDDRGLWIDLDMTYEGSCVLILQTKLNLMKLKHPHTETTQPKKMAAKQSPMYNEDVDDSAESSDDEEHVQIAQHSPGKALDEAGNPVQGLGGTSNTSKRFMKMVDKIAESRFFQVATEYKYIKNLMEGVSKTDLRLKVEVRRLSGVLVLNIPPPPSDRVWVGFQPTPKLTVSAQPIFGERNITMMRVITWIERRLIQEFQKVMVIPNMEDVVIPVMCPKLPE